MNLNNDYPYKDLGIPINKSVSEMSLSERRRRDKLKRTSYREMSQRNILVGQLRKFGFVEYKNLSNNSLTEKIYVNDFSYNKNSDPLNPTGNSCDIAVTDEGSAIVFSLSRHDKDSPWWLSINCATPSLSLITNDDTEDKNFITNLGFPLELEQMTFEALKNFDLGYTKSKALQELEALTQEKSESLAKPPVSIAKQNAADRNSGQERK